MARVRGLAATLAAVAALALAPVTTATAVDPVPPFIPADAAWLNTVNYYRSMAGVSPVVDNTTWSQGAYNHSCYMLYNGIAHDEIAGRTGYTSSGDIAGNNGNVAVSSAFGASARSHIELWMTGPFHAIGVLRHNLYAVGFGKCDLSNTPTWHSGATLNVLSGLISTPRPATPILFPGDGTTTNLNQFITESPNPLTFCGWSGSAGLPVVAMMPEAISSVSASMTGPSGPIQTCRIFSGNTSGTAQSILAGDNAVSVIPRDPLSPGLYTVTVTTQARTVTWSFTVDPTAAVGIMPVPTATPAGPASGYTAVTPFRFADSRSSLRITPLLAGVPKRIRMAGSAGLPADVSAISANFTVVGPTGNSNITVYNCATVAPTASTVNFWVGETVANAGVFPLSAAGDICVVSPVSAHLIIDINGHFRSAGTSRYLPLPPTPMVDTTIGLNSSGRLVAGQVLQIDVPAAGVGVPEGASAVALIISGIEPTNTGYITAYQCNINRPTVSNVNPMPGTTRSNFAIVPLPATGELCLYAHSAGDITVDVLGYFTGTGTGTIVPSTPTRVTDTRDIYRPEMNLGQDGSMLVAGQQYTLALAGERNIPAGVKALSLNVTVVRPSADGSITVWQCGTQPDVSSITYDANKTVAGGMQVKLSANGEICVSASTDLHLVIDVTGWWN
ncbi:MAG: CAP domain-containing protein [Actinomycetota bacterium]|nr:CAP domain-containing protein [Actinomycetota bacterium]